MSITLKNSEEELKLIVTEKIVEIREILDNLEREGLFSYFDITVSVDELTTAMGILDFHNEISKGNITL